MRESVAAMMSGLSIVDKRGRCADVSLPLCRSTMVPTSLGAAEIIFLSGLVRWPRMLSGGLGLLTGPD